MIRFLSWVTLIRIPSEDPVWSIRLFEWGFLQKVSFEVIEYFIYRRLESFSRSSRILFIGSIVENFHSTRNHPTTSTMVVP